MTNMNNREYSALMSAVSEIMEGRTVFVEETSSCLAEVKTFGMNWSACGTQNIEDAKKLKLSLDQLMLKLMSLLRFLEKKDDALLKRIVTVIS